LINTQRVDAFVLAGTTADDDRIRFLLNTGFPFVSFGRSNPEWDFNWVDTDGENGVYEAVSYLLNLGHRQIAMAAWPEESITGNFRLSGYCRALHDAGISVRSDYIVRGEHSEQAGCDALAAWCRLPRNEWPTAVVAVSDLVAIGVMNEAPKYGLEVGKTLSLIGYDDAPMTQYLRPALTTIQQPIIEIGQALIELLEADLRGEEAETRHMVIRPQFMVRESCGPAPR
jgi:DNA-binding LacI/PurR family transcriptional regulator